MVVVDHVVDLYEGLKEKEKDGKVYVYEGILTQEFGSRAYYRRLYDYYINEMEKQYANGVFNGATVEVEVPDDLLYHAKSFTDTAIITISRFSAEDFDRTSEKGYVSFRLWIILYRF